MHTTAFWLTLGHSLLAELPFTSFRTSERHLWIALRARVDGNAADDVRPPGPWHCRRRTPAQRGQRDQLGRFAQHPQIRRRSQEFFEPNLYIYDAYPGGIGFSEPLYRTCDALLDRTLRTDQRLPVRERMSLMCRAGLLTEARGRRKSRLRFLDGCVSRRPCSYPQELKRRHERAKREPGDHDRFHGLKALRRSSAADASERQWQSQGRC